MQLRLDSANMHICALRLHANVTSQPQPITRLQYTSISKQFPSNTIQLDYAKLNFPLMYLTVQY